MKKILLISLAFLFCNIAFASQMSVVVELFSADGCPYCPQALDALDQLNDNYDRVVPLIYKGFYSPDYNERAGFYGVGGIPNIFVGGDIDAGSGSYSSLEYYYNQIILEDSPLSISLSYESDPDEGFQVYAEILETGTVTTTNNKVLLILADRLNSQYFSTEEALSVTNYSSSVSTYSQHYMIPEDWNFTNLRALAFVQSYSCDKIVQAVQIFVEKDATVQGTVYDDYTGLPLCNAEITCGSFSTFTDLNGEFDLPVIHGNYNLTCSLPGYFDYQDNIYVAEDQTLDLTINLEERKLPPNNLEACQVTDGDVLLTWTEPGVYQGFFEDFEEGILPSGWETISHEDVGWFITQDGGSGGFNIPPHSYYAVSNDDDPNDDSSMDYIITPSQDFSLQYDVQLTFDSFYTGMYDEIATIEASMDGCETWQILYQLDPSDQWTTVSVSLSGVCGSGCDSVYIAFHADDSGGWASGWAIDNVTVGEGTGYRDLLGYNVYEVGIADPLNDELIPITENEYLLEDVQSGSHSYYITAFYSSGESDPSTIVTIEVYSISAPPDVLHAIKSYPNPFYSCCYISFYSLKDISEVTCTIYDMRGSIVRRLSYINITKGIHSICWNGKDEDNVDLGSGIFFIKLDTGSYKIIKKILRFNL
ncbi:MAG: choice-of-anchor J domain-containing protein [Candidatus Celaenobacter antarcticus]|nr:choice-of-anchor J domain-containing protein [Candidatus Celaenobacter antarcticus]